MKTKSKESKEWIIVTAMLFFLVALGSASPLFADDGTPAVQVPQDPSAAPVATVPASGQAGSVTGDETLPDGSLAGALGETGGISAATQTGSGDEGGDDENDWVRIDRDENGNVISVVITMPANVEVGIDMNGDGEINPGVGGDVTIVGSDLPPDRQEAIIGIFDGDDLADHDGDGIAHISDPDEQG